MLLDRVPRRPFAALADHANGQATQASIAGDAEYHQKLRDAESKGLFIPGQIEDVVMRAA